MKLSDYLAQFVADELGVKKVFLVIGGVCAHIVDSLELNDKIDYIPMQHEQSAAMAVDAYSRMTKNFGVAVATSGPGATNLITGVACAHFDSTPCMFISGQVNAWETKGKHKMRQFGFQETDIVDMVRPITKYSVMVTDPQEFRYELEKAAYLAKHGRPGPVWLDIPMNVQHAEIDPEKMRRFDPNEIVTEPGLEENAIKEVIESLLKAERPAIIAGYGIQIAKGEDEFFKLADSLKVPVVSTWSAIDLMPYDYPYYVGQFGVYGSRAANFTVQNADLVLSIGSRLDTRQTGGQPQTFSRKAKKIVVDIDPGELYKPWVKADLPIEADAKEFLQHLNMAIGDINLYTKDWLTKTMSWKEKYPTVLPEYYDQKDTVNAYAFIDTLAKKLPEGATIVPDQGGNLTWTIQAFQVKKGQKLFSAFGNSPMGYALPASIGASFAKPGEDVICIDGDGGFQMNIQELQTIRHHNLPIKIFIINNNSYGIIKQFQEIYFEGRYAGSIAETGYTAPNLINVAHAYGIHTETINDNSEMKAKIERVLKFKGPILCNVIIDEDQKLSPKLTAVKSEDGQRYISKPIEDMVPLLPRDEFYANMIVEPLDEGEGGKDSKEVN
jgi:acetolactate synthase I/II/III large subunit